MLKDALQPVKQNKTIMLVIGIIIIIAIGAIILKVIAGAKKGTAAAGDIAARPIIEVQTGISPARQIICEQVAYECRAAVYYWAFIGAIAWVKDDALTTALNKLLTRQEAAYCSQHYRTLSNGKSLLAVVNSAEYRDADSIKSEIRQNLS
jgi:hypothetical protein